MIGIESWANAIKNSEISSASKVLKSDLIVACELPYIVLDVQGHTWVAADKQPFHAYGEGSFVVFSGDQCVVMPEPVFKAYFVLFTIEKTGIVAKVECTGRDLTDSVLPRYMSEFGVKQFMIFEDTGIPNAPNF